MNGPWMYCIIIIIIMYYICSSPWIVFPIHVLIAANNRLIFNITDLSLVECYETVECSNSTSTLMTAADCCLRRISGLAYIKPGSEKCHTCIGNFLPTDSITVTVANLDLYSLWVAPRLIFRRRARASTWSDDRLSERCSLPAGSAWFGIHNTGRNRTIWW